MLLYFLLLFYWIYLLFSKRRQPNNLGLFWVFLPLYLIMGLKAVSVGCDSISYYNRYIEAQYLLTLETEPLYNIISYFFHDVLGASYYFYNATVYLFICVVLALFIKYYSKNVYFSLILFLTIGLFTPMMSGIRQSLAVSLCTIPLILLKAKEDAMSYSIKLRFSYYFLSILCVIAAYFIHNSAIIFLPILFLRNIELTKMKVLIIFAVPLIMFFFREFLVDISSGLVAEKYEKYDLNEGYNMNVLVLLFNMSIVFFCVFLSQPATGAKKFSKDISLMFIFLMLQLTFLISSFSHNQLARLGYYFANSFLILIPYAVYSRPKEERKILMVCVILISMVYFYFRTDGGILRLDDYKFFWQESLPSI